MTANTEHADKRRCQRVTIADHPQVNDAHSDDTVGQLVNLSCDGLMIAGNRPIAPNTVLQMRLPLNVGGSEHLISVGAESLWCEDANGSGLYWTGFHIIDISADDQEKLDAIVYR